MTEQPRSNLTKKLAHIIKNHYLCTENPLSDNSITTMTKTYILTVFVYNGTVMIQHQSYAFSTEALAVKTKEALQKINKEKADKRLRIAYSIQEAPLYKVITDIPIFKDYQPTEAPDAPAQQSNAPTQEPTDTAETSIADEEANAVSTAASSTSDSGTTELAAEAQEPANPQPANPQEVEHKSVRKITFKKTATKPKKK